MRRVAITGMGIVSCLGNDQQTVADALRNVRLAQLAADGQVSQPNRDKHQKQTRKEKRDPLQAGKDGRF